MRRVPVSEHSPLVEALNGMEIGTFSGMGEVLDRLWRDGYHAFRMRMGEDVLQHYRRLSIEAGSLPADQPAIVWGHLASGEIIPVEPLVGDPARVEFYAER